MEHKEVVSSNLKSIGYDEKNQILEVEFRNATIYQYKDVPVTVLDELMTAESKGKYFHDKIRERFEFTKIR